MNKANILSNELDQAPKTHKAGYQHRIKELSKDIESALDQIYLTGDEAIESRFSENGNSLPLYEITKLQDGKTLALELKREKTAEKRGGRNEAPSMPIGPERSLFLNSHNTLSKNTEPLKAGEKAVYLLIKKTYSDPKFPHNKNYEIKAVEFSVPGENTLLSGGLFFEEELKGEAFRKALT